jgi:hypothetical protein
VALDQSFGDQISLLGYDLAAGEGQPGSAHSEAGRIYFTFYWQAKTIPAADYTVFLHLRDASNRVAAQQDNPPAAGRYPTSLWDTGEIIVDEISLAVADLPPGRYTPVVGLYNFTTGQRLATPGQPAPDELALEAITWPGAER